MAACALLCILPIRVEAEVGESWLVHPRLKSARLTAETKLYLSFLTCIGTWWMLSRLTCHVCTFLLHLVCSGLHKIKYLHTDSSLLFLSSSFLSSDPAHVMCMSVHAYVG